MFLSDEGPLREVFSCFSLTKALRQVLSCFSLTKDEGPSSSFVMFLSDEGPSFKTLDLVFRRYWQYINLLIFSFALLNQMSVEIHSVHMVPIFPIFYFKYLTKYK